MLKASVIIPHYNDLENLGTCLELLERQTMPRDSFEIIVSDNGSACGLDAVRAAVAGRARVVEATEQGAGPARNAGLAAARAEALAFIDSDCRPEPDWLEAGLRALADSAVVGGRVRLAIDPAVPLRPVEAFEAVFAFRNDVYVRRKGFTVTANMFVRREVFAVVGGFRNHVSEDVDWCHRARAAGFALAFAPEAVVSHPPRRDWAELARKWRRLTRESYLLSRERPLGRIRWLVRSWAVLLSSTVHAFTVLRSPSLAGPRDRAAAIAILFRIRAYRFVEAHRALLGHR